MSLKANFELLAEYNQQMNERIYEASSTLSGSELTEDRGAFFGSILATLNHVLVGDTIWLKRFADHPAKLRALDYVRGLNSPQALDSVLYSEIEGLRSARTKMDSVIQEFSYELTEEILTSPLRYSNTKGEPFTKNFGYLIQHFFNHQTHHRGQITTLLYQAGIDVGVTDLLACIPSDNGRNNAKRLVPVDKFDDEACKNLELAKDEDLKPHIEGLLECLQDINWPIAAPVSERLSKLGTELVKPILKVLSGDDEMWKYWLVSHFLHEVSGDVFRELNFKLHDMKIRPTKGEIEEEVYDAVCVLLRARKYC